MLLSLSSDQLAIREHAERMFRDLVAAAAQGARPCPDDTWETLEQLGWTGLLVPESSGGSGAGVIEIGLLMEAAGQFAVPTYFSTYAIGGLHLLSSVSDCETAAALLLRGLAGEAKIALAHIEAEFCDVEAILTTADHTEQGWTLHGHKANCLGGSNADYFLISANLRETSEPGIFLLPTNHPGLTVDEFRTLRGDNAIDINLNLSCSNASLIARGGAARQILTRITDELILAHCWEAVGCIGSLVRQTNDYVKMRQQFGKPLWNFQSVQHRIAEMIVQYEEALASVHLASAKSSTSSSSFLTSASKAKVSMAARYVSETAVQLHGGVGVTDELDVSRYFRMLLAFQAFMGSEEQHLQRYFAGMGATARFETSAAL